MTISEVSRVYDLTLDTLRYYERVGMIPPVNRTQAGIRDYNEDDCKWVKLAKCMRSAGLPVEVMIEYVKLTQQGNGTILARSELLKAQKKELLKQKSAIDATLEQLNYKIDKYEVALETGVLSWGKKDVEELK